MLAPKWLKKVVGLIVTPVPRVKDRTLKFVDQLVILNIGNSELTTALAILGQVAIICEKFCPGVLRWETRFYESIALRTIVHINIRFQNKLTAKSFTVNNLPFEEWLERNEQLGLWMVREYVKKFQTSTCFDRGTAEKNVLDSERLKKRAERKGKGKNGKGKKEREGKGGEKSSAKMGKETKLTVLAGTMSAGVGPSKAEAGPSSVGAGPSGVVEADEPVAEEEGPVFDEEGIEMSEVRKGKRKAP